MLTREAAWAYGAKGVAARASGVDRDARRDHPHAAYGRAAVQRAARAPEGDVFARVMLRVDEMSDARDLIRGGGRDLPRPARTTGVPGGLRRAATATALGWAEGWRGQILDWVRMRDGVIDRAVIRDPSFCNWPLFGELGPGNIVPDFPLCNKSLNLSYSGTDL